MSCNSSAGGSSDVLTRARAKNASGAHEPIVSTTAVPIAHRGMGPSRGGRGAEVGSRGVCDAGLVMATLILDFVDSGSTQRGEQLSGGPFVEARIIRINYQEEAIIGDAAEAIYLE